LDPLTHAIDHFIGRHHGMREKSVIDVSHAAPAVVFLQYATRERFLTAERDKQYAAVVSEPKRFKLYDAPHALDAEARRDRIAFLIEQLQLNPVPPAAIAAIPELPQPPEPNP
jgi:hypothetical protein